MKLYLTFTFVLTAIMSSQTFASPTSNETLNKQSALVETHTFFDKNEISQIVDLANKQAISIESIALDTLFVAQLSTPQAPVFITSTKILEAGTKSPASNVSAE